MNFIKELFRPVVKIAVAVTVAVLLALTVAPAHAQSPQYLSFIPPNGNVLLPFSAAATSTNYSSTYGATYTGTNGFFYIKDFVQTNSTVYPYVSGYNPVWLQGNPFADVGLWANRDGTPPLANFSIVAVNENQSAGAATNILKITLTTLNRTSQAGSGPQGPIYNNQGQNQFTLTVTNIAAMTNALGYDTIALSTNISTSFLQGALAVQAQINVGPAGTNAGTAYWTNVTGPYGSLVTNTVNGWLIQSMGISGYKPNGP